MRKIILATLILLSSASATELKMNKINTVLSSLKTKDGVSVRVFTDLNIDPAYKVSSLGSADFSIHKAEKDSSTMQTSYKKMSCQKSLGAIYVKKHRTQIVFIKEKAEEIFSKAFLKKIKNYMIPRAMCEDPIKYAKENM